MPLYQQVFDWIYNVMSLVLTKVTSSIFFAKKWSECGQAGQLMLPETSDLPMHVGDVSFSLNEMQADPDLAFRTQSRVFDEGEHFIFLNVFFSIISAI